jgi:predicted 3-demethylubiquinone-9 3-methyltransferase (glyoxalase superfamily)
MQPIRPCLVFKDRAEEAIDFYVSLFDDARVIDKVVSEGGASPIPSGKLLHATFELGGQVYTAFDGGETFAFSEAFSLVATCDSQEEIDDVWAKLTAAGGEPGPCGWCKDRFGLSWQVVPAELGRMLGDPASGNSAAAMQAMLQMGKLDIATLRRAYESAA